MTSLQAQLSQVHAHLAQVQEVNDQLSMANSDLTNERDKLMQQARDGEVRGQDLNNLLAIISDGVTDSNLKVGQNTSAAIPLFCVLTYMFYLLPISFQSWFCKVSLLPSPPKI